MAVQIPFTNPTSSLNTSVVEDAFLMDLLQQSQSEDKQPEWLNQLRAAASNWVSRLQVPTRKDEEWRFTDLAALVATKFVAANISDRSIEVNSLPETDNSRLVFVDGIYRAELSDISGLSQDIYVGNLANLPNSYPISDYLGRSHDSQAVFTSLNTAGFKDVAIIWTKKNAIIESPIHLVVISSGDNHPTFSQPRSLIIAEANSSLSIVEEYYGTGTYFTNAVSEVWLKENSSLKHTRLQKESETSFHIGTTAISQARDSRYSLQEINLGGKLSRHNPQVLQQGAQIQTNLQGLTVATGEQTADTHSIIALTQPHGITNQLHKCIAGDRAHVVFNGKVFVPKEAQLTDATQLNRNLLLSSKARVDTKPELQITADNVKCSHGATVSQLEAEEIFYLRSRGLTDINARQLLIDAFAAEIYDSLSLPSLKTQIARIVAEKTKN
jgi:Fe-S cluster assembly protein SufD